MVAGDVRGINSCYAGLTMVNGSWRQKRRSHCLSAKTNWTVQKSAIPGAKTLMARKFECARFLPCFVCSDYQSWTSYYCWKVIKQYYKQTSYILHPPTTPHTDTAPLALLWHSEEGIQHMPKWNHQYILYPPNKFCIPQIGCWSCKRN